MSKRDNRRKNYFIKKEFQRAFIIKFCSLVVLASVISGYILRRFARETVTTAFVDSRLSIISTADYLMPNLIASSLVAIILVSVATAIVVLLYSHRISGPLFNLERSAQKIAAGDLNLKVTLRSTDEVGKLAQCFNHMTRSLKTNISKIQTQANDLSKETLEIKNIIKDGSTDAHDALARIAKKKAELDKTLEYFKL